MPTVGHLERFAVGINTRNVDRAMSEISIDADELVRLTLDICNIESPAGEEAEVGAFAFRLDAARRLCACIGNLCTRCD